MYNDGEAAGNEALESAAIYVYDQDTNLLTDIWGPLSVIFDYDDNANTVSANNRTFVYDSSNQLIEVWDGTNQIAGYTYNGAGQRIKKWTSSGTRIFHYDLKGHLIAETTQGGTMIAEYVYLGDRLLAMITKPAETEIVSYFHSDHLGTPQVLTNDNENIVWKAAYTPFGGADISTETVINPFRLPGQYYDSETGLHYNYFRYYDPSTGRYVTPDPIGLEGGINLFSYVAGNPIIHKDRLGLFADSPRLRIPILLARGQFEEALVIAEAAGFTATANQIVQLTNRLNSLMQKYPSTSLKCDRLANKLYDVFKSNKLNPKIIEITDQQGAQYFITNSGETFATSGYHRAVQLGDMVFDALTGPAGMEMSQYMNMLTKYGIYPIIKK